MRNATFAIFCLERVGSEPLVSLLDHRKLRTRPLRETIGEWDELSAKLRGTRFEPLLAETP